MTFFNKEAPTAAVLVAVANLGAAVVTFPADSATFQQ